MNNNNLVIFKKQQGEKVNSYSIVSDSILTLIPKNIILKTVKTENRLYSKEELEKLRDKNL